METPYKQLTEDDVIGTVYKCPYPNCKVETIITKAGLKHFADQHYQVATLKNIWMFLIIMVKEIMTYGILNLMYKSELKVLMKQLSI